MALHPLHLHPLPLTSVAGAFLLAFPALFSIVNPVGMSLIFNEATQGRTEAEHRRLAGKVAVYSAAILLGSVWLGAYILTFFGVSLGALRIAGGMVVAFSAWRLLMEPDTETAKESNAVVAPRDADDIAFFPLTMPLTTGPGSISVAIALSSQRPAEDTGVFSFFAGCSLAALAVAILVWLAYRSSNRIQALLGSSGARVVSKLVAFLLLCVGVQIGWTGIAALIADLPAAS